MSNKEEVVEIREWIGKGAGIMVSAYALDPNDPDHVYNQIVAQGKNPEDFGIFHPYTEEYKDKSRSDLIFEILELKKEIKSMYRSGLF